MEDNEKYLTRPFEASQQENFEEFEKKSKINEGEITLRRKGHKIPLRNNFLFVNL